MPIYEYQCTSCGHKLEAFQKISDDPLRDCPECEAPSLKKCVTAAAFKLKGSGWYETDFKDKKKTAGASDKGAGKTEDSAKAKTGSKDTPAGAKKTGEASGS